MGEKKPAKNLLPKTSIKIAKRHILRQNEKPKIKGRKAPKNATKVGENNGKIAKNNRKITEKQRKKGDENAALKSVVIKLFDYKSSAS